MLFISMDHRPAIVSPASKMVHPTMTESLLGAPKQRTVTVEPASNMTTATGGVSTVSRMDGTTSQFSTANGHRHRSEISPMHAAAVNGDKSSLSKLLTTSDLNAGDKFGRTPLMYCVLGDRLECAEMLTKANADVNKQDIGGRTALHWAAHKGNFACLRLLMSKGATSKLKDNEGQTAMHLSTRHKSIKCLALLMKQLKPGEVDDQDNNKRTALHWAASYGNLEHVKMLIKQDSNIGIPDVEGRTPLHWAASSKGAQAVDCVHMILETTPSVINWQDYDGRTALHLAVAEGTKDVVNVLTSLDKCNVSALDNMFRTPLHWGAVLGHSEIVAMLLHRKADCVSSDSNGATPLHYAAQNNFAATVEVFVLRPEVKDEPDIEGRTAFMWAASKGADDVILTFVKCGVDIHQTGKNGGTALHAASLAGHSRTVQLLLNNGALINVLDLKQHTPLFRACEMGHTDVVQTLIDSEAKVKAVDQDGRSPLHWAALGGHAYICQTLIKEGIGPNVRDHSGRTPLQCSAYVGYVNCMSVLIEHDADANAQDNEGMTALHWACSKGHLDAVKLLIEFHAFPNHMEYTEDRYTPLDYALMGEHYAVAQYMIEQGALSITGIQDIAALKIQAVFRGYRIRKTFLERKKLLMKHEQLRKDAAKKKAEEEYRRREDWRHKKEVLDRRHQELHDTTSTHAGSSDTGDAASWLNCHQTKQGSTSQLSSEGTRESGRHVFLTNVPSSSQVGNVPSSQAGVTGAGGGTTETKVVTTAASSVEATSSVTTTSRPVYRKKKKTQEVSQEELIMTRKQDNQKLVAGERSRLFEHRSKDEAARVIQRAWHHYKRQTQGELIFRRAATDAVTEKRLEIGEAEWQAQIAALTIQLAWRKYFRKKLLRCLSPKNRKILHAWHPGVVAAKQRALVEQIYKGGELNVPGWHPKLHAPVRPSWFQYVPSPAAVSFNFAVDQYLPVKVDTRPGSRYSWANYEFLDVSDEFGDMKLAESFLPHHYSYNLHDS